MTLTQTTLRVCETEGCETLLSRWNNRPMCSSCEARDDTTLPLPRPPRFPPRELVAVDPSDGGMPLPAPVKGPDRSYAEMIAVSGGAEPESTCAQCGRPMPAKRHGWLCVTCQLGVGGVADILPPLLEAVENQESGIENPDAPADVEIISNEDAEPTVSSLEAPENGAETEPPAESESHSKTSSKAPAGKATRKPRAKDKTRRIRGLIEAPAKRPPGQPRRFDHAAAADLFLECRNYAEVGRRFGVRTANARRAVINELERRDVPVPEARHGRPPNAVRTAQTPDAAAPDAPTAAASPPEDPTPPPPVVDLPPQAPRPVVNVGDLDAELTRLELELDHIADEQTRLSARWRAATTRWSEVIALMAAHARQTTATGTPKDAS